MVSTGKRVVSAAAPRISRGRGTGTRGAFDRGTCPVCRKANIGLRVSDGKMLPHGRNAANPAGCAGKGEPPYRERRQPLGKLPVADIRPVVAHDQGAVPDLDLDVLVERREPDAMVRVREQPPPTDGAA